MQAFKELSEVLEPRRAITPPNAIYTTYNSHSSPNNHNLSKLPETEKLLETFTMARDQNETQQVKEQLEKIRRTPDIQYSQSNHRTTGQW